MAGRTARLRRVLVALGLIFAAASAVHARCGDGLVMIQPGTAPALKSQICAAVEHAEDLLRPCGLTQSRPIEIQIVPEFSGAHAACGARFDCETDTLEIMPPAALAQHPGIETAFADLAPEALFHSLIVHELAHAYVDQTLGREITRIAHEYLAYAMQIQSLPASARADVLAKLDGRVSTRLDDVNGIVLAFSPSIFAANAFAHFSAPGNGCTIIDALRNGGGSLPYEFQVPPEGQEDGP